MWETATVHVKSLGKYSWQPHTLSGCSLRCMVLCLPQWMMASHAHTRTRACARALSTSSAYYTTNHSDPGVLGGGFVKPPISRYGKEHRCSSSVAAIAACNTSSGAVVKKVTG